MPRRPFLLPLLFALAACADGRAPTAPEVRIAGFRWGRLVDVYGWRTADGVRAPERVATDVVLGPLDGEPGEDVPGFHRWLGPDPVSLQPRFLVDAEIGSREFDDLRARLGRDLPLLESAPVARDAALVIELDGAPWLPDDFFFLRGPDGAILGPGNAEAVQLLEVRDADARPFPRAARIVARGARIIVDPLVTGDEASGWGLPPVPGLPPPTDGTHLRLAVGLEGPNVIPGLWPSGANGTTSTRRPARVVDFRAAADGEDGAFVANGHLPDRAPPRLLGDLPLIVVEVDPPVHGRQRVRVYKDGLAHDIDAGDALRARAADGAPLETTEVLVDPEADDGRPGVGFVDVLVRAVDGLGQLDPRLRPDRPSDPGELVAWLVASAPRLVLTAPFESGADGRPADDPAHFVRFAPEPEPLDDGGRSPPNRNLSPFVEPVVRFDRPVDPRSLRPHDSFLVALRDVLDADALVRELVTARGVDPSTVSLAKLATPFLVASRLTDVRLDRTTFRLTPVLGLHLDERMRSEDGPRPFDEQRFRYALLLRGGARGVRSPSGTALDLGTDHFTLPFALDLRRDARGPRQPDNPVFHCVRRFDDRDEDERPSVLREDEVVRAGVPARAEALPLDDWFGAHTAGDGFLAPRPTSRITRYVDDVNQPPVPSQESPMRHCPESFAGEGAVASRTAAGAIGSPLANPLNPAGARLQSVWREIDLGLARLDPRDMDLEVESMSWAPWGGGPVEQASLNGVSLWLGHAERRPEPCVGVFAATTLLPDSGLVSRFADNYAHDIVPLRGEQVGPPPHIAFADAVWTIDPIRATTDPTGTHRYLPLPPFREPYFVWRDETLSVQGGDSGHGSDVRNANPYLAPYIPSPFGGGRGRTTTGYSGALGTWWPTWNNAAQFHLAAPSRRDLWTDGGLGAIALPLLADIQVDGFANGELDGWGAGSSGPGGGTDCGGYRGPGDVAAPGRFGWAASIATGCAPSPSFRAVSAGDAGVGGRPALRIGPQSPQFESASGAYAPSGYRTAAADNTVYWAAFTFLKRRTVATAGFVDLHDPHRVDVGVLDDPRLGPREPLGAGETWATTWAIDPPLEDGSVVVELRAAGAVDPDPWMWREQGWPEAIRPDADNVPLDPFKAGDAALRKWDDRPGPGGVPRDAWTHPYHRVVTDYVEDPERLRDREWLWLQAGAGDAFTAQDVRYVNWRLVIADGERAPPIDSFAVAFRVERAR